MTRWVMGIDENGMGPRLGPLMVTSVLAQVDARGERTVHRKLRGEITARLGDSKALVAYGEGALGEAWARAIGERMGCAAASPAQLLKGLLLDPEEALRARCPEAHASQCWDEGDAFVAPDEAVAQARADLETLLGRGVRIAGVRVAKLCTDALNEGAARGRSRFAMDLHAMERLFLSGVEAARRHDGRDAADVWAVAGKVGGYAFYGSEFGPLAGRLHTVLEEGRARSEYAFPTLGRIAFVRDADASHALVSLASLVGKWARDLFMQRIVRHHRRFGELPDASGYHDPVTARFVERSRVARRGRAFPDTCFERTKRAPAED